MTQHLLIFELEVVGHHPGYLHHLLRYWPDANTHLHFVVSPEFALQHEDVMQTPCRAQVTWEPITTAELQLYTASKRSLLRRTWVEWQLYRRYAQKSHADQGLIMYLDRFQLPLALRFFLPCQTSGIFFRPKFHYKQYNERALTTQERVNSLREQLLWRSALHHPQLKTLFCLDPFAVEPLQALGGRSAVVHLPDPVEVHPQPAAAVTRLRQQLAIAPARLIFLLFGMIDQRKGIYQVLEALQRLPAAQQSRLTLLLVGQLAEADKADVLRLIAALTADSALQIVVRDQYVNDAQIQCYFELADVVLALYQRHVGSSGILIRAAAAGKPVLASDYGLMGELVRQHKLGRTVDSTDPLVIANHISHLFCQPPEAMFDRIEAAQFATKNSASAFMHVLREGSIGEQKYAGL